MAGQVRLSADAARRSFECSVVVALYNKADYVERAILSALQQTVPAREIIVVDDGSTDDGPARVAALAKDHPSIRLIRQSNAGVSAGRNRGIREARGDFVAFLDADDGYLPWFLEEMAALAQTYPEAVFQGAAYKEVAPDFDLAQSRGLDNAAEAQRTVVTHFYDRWWHGNMFHVSSLCVRRAALQAMAEPFPLGENRGEDLDLFFRLAEQGPLAVTSRICALYAVGVPNGLMSGGVETDMVPSFWRLRSRSELASFPQKERAGARRCIATKMLVVARTRSRRGDQSGAIALMCDPITLHRPSYWLRTAGLVTLNAITNVFAGRGTAPLSRT